MLMIHMLSNTRVKDRYRSIRLKRYSISDDLDSDIYILADNIQGDLNSLTFIMVHNPSSTTIQCRLDRYIPIIQFERVTILSSMRIPISMSNTAIGTDSLHVNMCSNISIDAAKFPDVRYIEITSSYNVAFIGTFRYLIYVHIRDLRMPGIEAHTVKSDRRLTRMVVRSYVDTCKYVVDSIEIDDAIFSFTYNDPNKDYKYDGSALSFRFLDPSSHKANLYDKVMSINMVTPVLELPDISDLNESDSSD